MTAGPSEITIVCDKFSNPEWLASDLIGQAEHDILAQCILISRDKNFITKVQNEVLKQLKLIPRKSIAKKSLIKNGILMHVKPIDKIIKIVNHISPEHLELNIKNYKTFLSSINSMALLKSDSFTLSAACG